MQDAVSLTAPPKAYDTFTEEEVLRLRRFSRQVRELERSSFFKHPGHQIKATLVGSGQAREIRVDSPGEEAVRAVVLIFRELYTDSNETSARAVLNILERRARTHGTIASGQVRHELKELRDELTHRKRVDPRMGLLVEGREGPVPPNESIDLLLNGDYFHYDEDKAEDLTHPITVEMRRAALHSAIRDFAILWKHVADRVDAVLVVPSLHT